MRPALGQRRIHSAGPVLLLVSALAFLGCTALADTNRANLQRLALGMSRANVVSIMGPPDLVEASRMDDGHAREVLYYITENPPGQTPWRKELCTPLVLVDGKLIGWGQGALEAASR